MAYNITLPLPEGWTCITDSYQEFDGSEVTHLDARLADERTRRDKAFINIYVGPMPPDTSAEDEALANYADMVGWSETMTRIRSSSGRSTAARRMGSMPGAKTRRRCASSASRSGRESSAS